MSNTISWHDRFGWLCRCIALRALSLELFFHWTYLMNECQNQLKRILLFSPNLEGNCRLVSLPLYQCNFMCVITFELNVRRASPSDQICWLLIYERYVAKCVLHALMETLPRVRNAQVDTIISGVLVNVSLSLKCFLRGSLSRELSLFTALIKANNSFLSEASVKYLQAADV